MLTKRLKDERTLGLHYAPLGSADTLHDSLLRASVWHTFFAGAPLPESKGEFDARIAERGGRWIACFDALLGHAKAILSVRFAAIRALTESRSPAYVEAVKAMTAQIGRLVPADFLDRIPLRYLGDVPRYLDAVLHRLEGLQGRVDKDRDANAEIDRFEARLERVIAKLGARDDLDDARFLIEEYRVGVFAQRLRTRTKVSAKRIDATLSPLEEEAGVR
jgi:ATP-dependent helicase HrpA